MGSGDEGEVGLRAVLQSMLDHQPSPTLTPTPTATQPQLKRQSNPLASQDAAFMVWAGLRGAVGLALALLVAQTGGDQRAGKQMLFMVAGLAFLTLIVNGTTSGPLLEWWGMLGVPEVFIIFLVNLIITRLRLTINLISIFNFNLYSRTWPWLGLGLRFLEHSKLFLHQLTTEIRTLGEAQNAHKAQETHDPAL